VIIIHQTLRSSIRTVQVSVFKDYVKPNDGFTSVKVQWNAGRRSYDNDECTPSQRTAVRLQEYVAQHPTSGIRVNVPDHDPDLGE